jgi:hypothetical protein
LTVGRNERNYMWKEDTKFLFADNLILYLNDPKNCTKKHLDHLNTFSKAAKEMVTRMKRQPTRMENLYQLYIKGLIYRELKKLSSQRINNSMKK